MKSFLKALAGASLVLFAWAGISLADPTLVNDQIPAPVPSASNTSQSSELYTQSYNVPGGALYQTILKAPGVPGLPIGVTQTFVPGGGTQPLRYLDLTSGKSDLGVPMTAAAGTPTGTVGVSRTAGTSLVLVGEATSSSAKTNKVMWEFNLPSTYIAGANIPLTVNCNYTGSGTVTAASTTMTVAFYTEVNGVETALTVSAAQQFTGTAANKTFTVTGTGLIPGQHVVAEAVMLVTTSAGAATGQINSVYYGA